MSPWQGGECELRASTAQHSTAHGFKYSSEADISGGGATVSRPRYISAVLTLKPERRRRTDREGRGRGRVRLGEWEGRRKGREERGRKGRAGEGSPDIRENSAAHTPATDAKS